MLETWILSTFDIIYYVQNNNINITRIMNCIDLINYKSKLHVYNWTSHIWLHWNKLATTFDLGPLDWTVRCDASWEGHEWFQVPISCHTICFYCQGDALSAYLFTLIPPATSNDNYMRWVHKDARQYWHIVKLILPVGYIIFNSTCKCYTAMI